MTLPEIERFLEDASCHGATDLPSGTRLRWLDVGIGPQAWRHAVFAPLGTKDMRELEADLGLRLPREYAEFLAHYNGITLYFGEVCVYGCRRNHIRTVEQVVDQPFSVLDPNIHERPMWLSGAMMIVGMSGDDWLACGGGGVTLISANGKKQLRSWKGLGAAIADIIQDVGRE